MEGGEMSNTTYLTKQFEYNVRGKKYVAYPLSLDQTEIVSAQLSALEKAKDDPKKIKECYVDITYTILKDCNEGITKEEISKNFPLSGVLVLLNELMGKKEIETLAKPEEK